MGELGRAERLQIMLTEDELRSLRGRDISIVLDAGVALDELRTSFTAIKGIGPMTADYVAARLGIPGAGSPYEVRPSRYGA